MIGSLKNPSIATKLYASGYMLLVTYSNGYQLYGLVGFCPKVSISPVLLSVREGDSAQFRCSAFGFPAPVLQWHGGPDSKLPSEAILSNDNGLLTIPKVEKIHEGKYFCTAENLGGISGTSAFLNVSGKKLILNCSSFCL